jgi:hypothetical protein
MRVKSKISIDVTALRALKAGFAKAGHSEIQLGIFTQKNPRQTEGSTHQAKGDLDNADIGAVHEFGSKKRNIPGRSFLRMPMQTKMGKELKRLNIAKSVMRIGPTETLREIGQIAEGQVDQAFTSSGYGTWAPNSKRTIARKKGASRPLIDTSKLRAAVSSRVVAKGGKR